MKVLAALPPNDDPRLLVGTGHFDDAGVAKLRDDLALVQSTDFFPPVVDDPWWYGRIAAANALSDLYAMGAAPFSALHLVVYDTESLPLEVLSTILQGGEDAVREAGAVSLGGHSVRDEGIKYGLAVTGTLRPGEEWSNAGARPGDRLYLTKALGTGTITTAARKNKAREPVLEAAMRQMGALNAGAAQAARAAGVRAATDITGYGLAGHAHELAAASGVDVVLSAAALPLLEDATTLVRKHVSGGAARTRAHLGARLVADAGVADPLVMLATDSETSGGLLLAVGEAQARRLEDELAARDVLVCAVGEVTAPAGSEPAVRLRA